MKKFKLIFFMSLMLILILGTTAQAVVSEEYIKYTFEHFKNVNCLSSSESNVKQLLNSLNDSDYSFYTSYINNVLVESNIDKLTDHNMTSVIDAHVTGIGTNALIYFIFSNVSAPNGIDNLGFLEFSRVENFDNYLHFFCHDSNSYIYVLKLYISAANKNNFQRLQKVNNSEKYTVYYSRSFNLNANNSILTISNVACTQTQSVYYHVPFVSSGATIITPGFINGLSTDTDPGYFEIQTSKPPQPSGDTGGTTGTITNPSGDTTGKTDLSGIEQGIGAVKDAVNNVTNTIKDAFTFDSGDANEVMEDFKNTDLGLSQDLYDLNNQFFDLFKTQEMNDFVISWDGVNYQDIQLIPSGEVNFSALCRENEQIGKVKEYITLFAIVGSSLTLLKVIWNMISQMLGLNETLMETDFGDSKMYTYEDNSYDVDTRAYLDAKRYNRRR